MQFNVHKYDRLIHVCRYKNVYCAICNNVTDIEYWRVDIGLVNVANDSCGHILRSVTKEDIYGLRMDPPLQALKDYG